jgi:streptogramin lyase
VIRQLEGEVPMMWRRFFPWGAVGTSSERPQHAARGRDRDATRRRRRPGVEVLEARWLLTQINEFSIPSGDAPSSITTGPDGNLWFTESFFDPTSREYSRVQIGMINPTTHAITEFPIPSGDVPRSIAAGPDGNLWFTESHFDPTDPALNHGFDKGQIGMINPTTHAITEFPVPSSGVPSSITAGADGDLWFTESVADSGYAVGGIGMVDPKTHTIAEFRLPPGPVTDTELFDITSGPDGNLWFTGHSGEPGAGFSDFGFFIGQFKPTTRAIAEFPTPGQFPEHEAYSITSGPDGNLWFTESYESIGQINPTTHAITEFSLPMGGGGVSITAGPDGNLWFTEGSVNQIGRINPATHGVDEFPIPSGTSYPSGITAGPDGNLWFTENATSKIGQVVPPPGLTGFVSVTHKRKSITAIVLGFDESLVPASADTRTFYSLTGGVKKRHQLVYSKVLRIGGVSYDTNAHTVTIRLARPFKGRVEVTVHSGILATNGTSTIGEATTIAS